MDFAKIIRSKRKELQLTQESIALALNISSSAVSKWENGSSLPDIALLPALARLLKIDLNTLFNFEQELAPVELANFAEALLQTLKNHGLATGYQLIEDKLKEFPYDEQLILLAAQLIEAEALTQEQPDYLKKALKLFMRLEESDNLQYRFYAQTAQVRQLIRQKELPTAAKKLAEIQPLSLDTTAVKLQLYKAQHNEPATYQLLEEKIFKTVSDLYTYSLILIEAKHDHGEDSVAEKLANSLLATMNNYQLAPFLSDILQLSLATMNQNASQFLTAFQRLMKEQQPWQAEQTWLYADMHTSGMDLAEMFSYVDLKQMLADESLDFMKGNREFEELKERILNSQDKTKE